MEWDDAKRLVEIMLHRWLLGDFVGIERQFTSAYAFGNENAAGKARLVLTIQDHVDRETAGARYLLERAEAYTDNFAMARQQLLDPGCDIDRNTGLVEYTNGRRPDEETMKLFGQSGLGMQWL